MRHSPPKYRHISQKVSQESFQAGFTLVEVMVVMLIVGLMAGVVLLNIPPQRDPVFVQGEKLASRLQMVSQTGMIEGRSLGVSFDQGGYSVLKYENNEWRTMARHEFQFDQDPTLTFSRNGAPINLETLRKSGMPAIRYDITGIATPFELSLETQSAKINLIGHVDASVDVTRSP